MAAALLVAAASALFGGLTTGCAGAREPESREATAGSEEPAAPPIERAPATSEGSALESASPAPAPAGPSADDVAVAVRARLEALPNPPIDASTPVGTITGPTARRVCRWLETIQGPGEMLECPDDRVVVTGAGACEGEAFAVAADCDLTLGELGACRAATRASPCHAQTPGDLLPECRPLGICRERIQARRGGDAALGER